MHSTRSIQIILLLVIIAFSNVKGQTEFPFSIAQYVETTDSLTTLRQVINNPGLIELFTLLDGNNSFTTTGPKVTLFAPTDEAFASLGLDLGNVPMTLNLIKYHIAPKEISTDSSSNLIVVKTLLNDSSLVQLPNGDGQAFYLTTPFQGNESISNGDNQQGKIVEDVKCSNGIINLIDIVLIPPRSLIDTVNSLELTKFADEFTKSNLLPNINVTRGITVFVPTNEAFNKPEVSAMDSTKRDSLLPLHVINGTVVYEIKTGKSDQTINGDRLNFVVKNEGGLDTTLYVNNARVEKTIIIGNGVMYVIDNVLLPGVEQNEDDDSKEDKDDKETKDSSNKKKDDDGGKRADKKLIIGAVMGGICGGIVISLTSCMIFKWYRAQKNANVAATGEILKSNTIS